MDSQDTTTGTRVSFSESIAAHFKSGEYSDLIVKCGSETFHVHKVVICGQCSFFKKACAEKFEEFKSNVIELAEDSPAAVKVMLTFLYGHTDLNAAQDEVDTATLIDVYALGVKYDLPALQDASITAFKEKAEELVLDKDHMGTRIETIYQSTNDKFRGLRDLVVQAARKHYKTLIDLEEFQKLISGVSLFAKDLLIALKSVINDGDIEKYLCPDCDQMNAMIAAEGLPQEDDCVRGYWCTHCGYLERSNEWTTRLIR